MYEIWKNSFFPLNSLEEKVVKSLREQVALNAKKSDTEFDVLQQIDYSEVTAERKVDSTDFDRYSDIVPFKYNRVKLLSNKYINASWIHVGY